MRRFVLLATILFASRVFAQTEVVYRDDFQSYKTPSNPPGWVDTSVGSAKPEAAGLYKAWPDPLQSSNVVYGTKQSSGKPEGNNPRIGTFSTLTTKKFDTKGRFEYSGRLLRTNADSRIGLTFLSSYPEADKYYLIGLWSHDTKLTMQLFAFGAGTLLGTVDSNVTIDPNKWYRFLIQVDNTDNATKIRARFWPDGTTEPTIFSIDASDAATTRLTTGRIGMWAAVKGDAYIDDLSAKSPVDHTSPVITFVDADTQRILDPAQLALFKTPARIEIRVTDDFSTVTYTAKLDGTSYTSATPITIDGLHKLTVDAVDGPGNTASASLDLLVDQIAPVIALQIDNATFANGAIFNKDVTLSAVVSDISTVTTTATLNGATITLPQPIAEERVHAISVTATDQVGRQSTIASSFIVDKTAPEITILADGVELGGGESFQNDVTLTWSATDLTFDRLEATLNGASITSGTKVTVERTHDLIVKAYDKAGHVTTETRRFVLDKTAPEVRVLANGDTFKPGTTFNAPVTFTVEANDSTPTTPTATLDNATYTLGTAISSEGAHTITVVVKDAGGLATTVGPSTFTIDLTPPNITLTESGEPFRDGMKFNRDIHPVVAATDNLTTNPTRELFLDDREFPLDTAISEEKADHVLIAKATDDGGNTKSVGPFHFVVDKTKPIVTIVEETTNKPFGDDALFARPVRVKITVTDLTSTTIAATLNGAPFDPNTSITADGTYTVSVVATDAVGWQNDPVTAAFTIDQTPPHLTFTSPEDNAVVSTPTVVLSGNADDAVTISIADAQATIDLAAKTFLSEPVALVEGANTLTAIAKDKAGNTAAVELHLELDTRAPEIVIDTPAIDACIDATTLTVSGTVSDPRVASVKVNDIPATLTNDAWTAAVNVDEGRQLLTITAADSLGHLTTITRSILIDRTQPSIEVRESGAPFVTGASFNRAVTLLIDADANTQAVATLDGAPYASGTPIDAEGAHTLEIHATDCAGHHKSESFAFTIDRTPPSLRNLNPANGATVGTLPTTITGTADPDTVSVELAGITASATPDFVLNNVPFAEGTNTFVLRATDRAGNTSQLDYSVTVKTTAPVITILESGTPLAPNSMFTRAITPEIKVSEREATISATLDSATYTPGTEIGADGEHHLNVTATDSLNHTGTAEVVFMIDRTPPSVHITFPQSGSVSAERVEVRGTATNAVTASVNGQDVALDANGAFVLPTLDLEFGTTRIVATARDRAGNVGTDEVVVTRDDVRPGILLTYPSDHTVTNRTVTEILGRVLSPTPDGIVTIGTHTTPVDPLGNFRFSNYPLVEGDNTITASTKTNAGGTNSVSVVVTADFTPPSLAILESNQPLNDGARFASEAVLSLQTSENATAELIVDGTKVTTMPFGVSANGGHVAVATARDRAGNETRIERTFFIGAAGSGAATCTLDNFDPTNNSVVLSASTTLLGRTTSIGIKANDVAAIVADGSFKATVELPHEGANTVTLRCTDGAGVAFGDPVNLTLNRVTGDPSIDITSPSEGFVTAEETITVSGTIGAGVANVDVNGAAAVIDNNTFTVPGVRLTGGLNILVARGVNAAGRVATASRRVTALREGPSLVISSPITGATTGAAKIDLAGTYAHLDPATITVTNASVTFDRTSDTTGTFLAKDVPLVSGEQTLRVTGHDQANRSVTASVVVRLNTGTPSITITAPANNAYFGASAGNTFTVSGTFTAAAGATVDVGGTAATISGSTFTATAPFATIGSSTTVIARVTEPGGASAVDNVIVNKLTAAPKVIESFPAPNAVEVDAGAAMLVLFSAPMDRASLANGAFRLEDPSGAAVSGTVYLDKDVLTFAPAALLTRGARYTLRVTTAAKDLAGTALESEYTAPFTIGTSAPSTPPSLTPLSEAFCGQTVAIKGTAPAGARVQLASGSLTLTALADAQGNFTFDFPLSGQSGFAIIRVRTIGSDGSLSPAAELSFRVDCVGPQVLNATYDRSGSNKLTINFSEPVDIPSGAIYVTLTDGRTVAVSNGTPAEDLTARSFTLTVTTAVRDTIGNHLAAAYTQTFTLGGEQPPTGDGSGFITGEFYDATTGRPLAGATISILNSQFSILNSSTDARGRYLVRLPEGAHTIRASMTGYTNVWRQIIVPAGAGVVPIDIRLTKRNDTSTHGGETAITRPVTITGNAKVTAIGAQALTGLLPLGWSPLASAEVLGDFTTATLTFTVPATTRTLTAVRYDEVRDEWNFLAAVVTISDNKVALPINAAGAYALVYPDTPPSLIGPVLTAVATSADPATPLVSRAFTLDPPVVLPNGRTVARLEIEGDFPSGTAVQGYIDEELRLADGSRLLDPPFAADLLLYRNLDGTRGIADFHLAPSPRAAQVILEVGFDHIRVVPYPGRLDRGTLIGSEGGRIPGDASIAVDIPAGATPEPLRASAVSLTQQDLDAIGTIQGFHIISGFTLTLQADTPNIELFKPARATFTLPQSSILNPQSQLLLAELVDESPYGKLVRLANQIERIDDQRATTKTIDRSAMPLDGITHEGRYLLLAADAPIAFATGVLRLGGALLPGARITATNLGVAELTRADGIYNIPVPATPASPFTLTPRHTSTGDGAPYTHTSAPAADAILRVDLELEPQPPTLVSVTVFANNAQVPLGNNVSDVSISTNVRATFTPAIDPTSINDTSITVLDAESNIAVSGKSLADGTVAVNWTLTPGTTLQTNHRYLVLVSPYLRGTSGAQFGSGASYTFTTVAVILNAEVHAERISITIPDANGVSRITGSAGALPANWQAVPVRRGKDFVTRYQATAANDGSFAFNIGGADDPVTMSDLIDLRVINNAGNLAAIIPLTPFVTEDRRGFVVPAGKAARFVTADNIAVDVPEGTFDVATLVTAHFDTKTTFDDIPALDDDLNFATGIKLDFEGRANKPIELDIPVPAGLDTTNRDFLLSWKGDSVRGPRLFAVDTLRVVNGKFTTAIDPAANAQPARIGTNSTFTGIEIKDYLLRVLQSGSYAVTDFKIQTGRSAGWALFSGLVATVDLFWSSLGSYYVPHWFMTERNTVAIPVIKGIPFTVVGVDATTGVQTFSRAYDPIPITDPLVSTIPPPIDNDGGPYPVFATPFRIETVDLTVTDINIRTLRNFIVRLSNGRATVSSDPDNPLPANTKIEMMNVSEGTYVVGTAAKALSLQAQEGQRLVLSIEQREIDPNTGISVVFNEPIYIFATKPDLIDAELRQIIKLRVSPTPPAGSTQPPVFTDISSMVTYSADSGGRRITLTLPASLQRESIYQLVLSRDIADRGSGTGFPGFTLGQGAKKNGGSVQAVGGGNSLYLEMRTRKPGGVLGSFDLKDGGTRDLALNGNILLVAASNGGLAAYDVADPAALTGIPNPIAVAPANGFDFWALASDHHGRIYTTALGQTNGVLRTYRLEDFLAGGTCCNVIGSTLINWRMGYSALLGVSAFLSDRPESFPRKLQLAVQDKEEVYKDRTAFIVNGHAVTVKSFANDIKQLEALFTFDPNRPYLYQRITVENESLDMRWSADATPASPAVIKNIIAGPNDVIRVLRNETTYGIVSHQGYGIGIYDLNAIESNLSPYKPTGYQKQKEQIVLTRGTNRPECFGKMPIPDGAIPDISVSADAAVRPDEVDPRLYIYAPEPYRGLLDMRFDMPTDQNLNPPGNTGAQCGSRSVTGLTFRGVDPKYDHPRLKALKDQFLSVAGYQPYPHFFSVASYRWRLAAADNTKGERWSIPNQDVVRDYVLVAGGDYGVLVLEVNGNPIPQIPAQNGFPALQVSYFPLKQEHLVDVIWIPDGALTVRLIPRTKLAVVVSRAGRVHLIDLSHLDERFDSSGHWVPNNQLFPTAAKALASPRAYPDGVGAEDPRILWTSEPKISEGVLPPVIDAESGMLYAGKMVTTRLNVLAAIDPRISMKVDLGEATGLSEVGGVVPHGIAPPDDIQQKIDKLPPCGTGTGPTRCKENASLGTFRLEVTLPGAVAEQLTASGKELQVAIESERVFNAPTEQTPKGFPRSHLRRYRRDGSAESPDRAAAFFRMQRVVPADPTLEKALRHQRGFNKFISPWVITLADLRASSKWMWPAGTRPNEKAEAGCYACERPRYLDNAAEFDGVYELFTNGRLLAVRPELGSGGTNIFAGTKYAYLGEQNRLNTRFATVMADTVRPPDIRVPGQNPAVAEGALQDTIYLHSGEYQVEALDLNAGGRAGFDVVFDRVYRSRTLGGSTGIGQGWESSNFRRLRPLPNGQVELRDSRGELWVFTPQKNDPQYLSPKGFFLRLIKTDNGWTLLDQQWRATGFDALGRLITESDEFANQAALGAGTNAGNAIRYLYDSNGRLAQIVDPIERTCELTYWKDSEAGQPGAYPGLLKQITDWRGRTVIYEYDEFGRLKKVNAPEAAAETGVPAKFNFTGSDRPRTEYTYKTVPLPPNAPAPDKMFNDYVEFIGNLLTVKDPDQVATGSDPRVTLDYEDSGYPRDRVKEQKWATGEVVKINNAGAADVTTVDALGQSRVYKLTDVTKNDKRIHIQQATVEAVSTIENGSITGPAQINLVPIGRDLQTQFEYNDEGLHTKVVHPNGLTITNTWAYATDPSVENDRDKSKAPGMVLESSENTGPGLTKIKTDIKYDQNKNHYNTKATPAAIKRGNDQREAQVPSGEQLSVEMQEDGYSVVTQYLDGLPLVVEKRDNVGTAQERTTTVYWSIGSTPLIGRQRPHYVNTGTGSSPDTQQEFTYDILPNGGEKVITEDKNRGTVSETHYDSWGRLTREIVTDANQKTLQDETSGYDAVGRLRYHRRTQTGVGDVVTTYEYDLMGRQTKMIMTEAAVNGTATTLEQITQHDFAKRTVTEFDPAPAGTPGAKTVKTLDGLGRPMKTERIGTNPAEVIKSITAFDRKGAASYMTDGVRMATVIQNDALGRPIVAVDSQGVRTTKTWADWNEPLETTVYDADNFVIAHSKNQFTPKGRLKSTGDEVGPGGRSRITRLTWEDGDTVHGTWIGEAPDINALDPVGDARVTIETSDRSGRKTHVVSGPAAKTRVHPNPDQFFSSVTMTYTGDYPDTVTVQEPRAGTAVQSITKMTYDGLGRVIVTKVDGAKAAALTSYDEAGNVVSSTTPGMTASTAAYDSRGLVKSATHPGGGTVKYTYDALGNMRSYEDEIGAKTTMVTDTLGRIVRTNYPDGTSEETVFEAGTGIVSATRDRADQWLAYEYGPEGRVAAVYSGKNTSGQKLVQYEYDKAGRRIGIFNANAGIVWENFDLLGRPLITRTYRYANGTGLKDKPDRVVLDVHTQEHQWSVYGERTSWTMPAAGNGVPPDDLPYPLWVRRVKETRDAAANLTEQRNGYGNIINLADGRATGKLDFRKRTMTTGSDLLETMYGYADGSTPSLALPSNDGADNLSIRYAQTSYKGVAVAGSANGRDVAERIARMRDLGTGNRLSDFSYDGRGRLSQTRLSMSGPTSIRPPTVDQYTSADFRSERDTTPILDPTQHQALGSTAALVETTTVKATENSQVHQILSRQSFLDGMPVSDPRAYAFQGGRRTQDGNWKATFDEFGRLITISNDVMGRRIEYTWGPNDRIVGRTALKGSGISWNPEDRPLVLREDGLPAKTTFVWDPIADRLLAIFAEGASTAGGPESGLLRQYLHGDQGMDDPVRIIAADESGAVHTYLPVVDEAGAGSLQAVVDASNGNLVERVLYADAYGDAPRYLQGAVVDQLAFEAKKDVNGELEKVTIRVHVSESIESTSLRDGMRLSVTDNSGNIVATSTATAKLIDSYTVQWELGAIEWTLLKDAGPTLEIAATDSLRFKRWGDTPVTFAPAWAREIFGILSTPDKPFALRQSFKKFGTFIDSIQPGKSLNTELYAMQDLYLAASTESKTKLLTGFKVAPFIEPATKLAYFRARWYDASTGSWLTPDPRGYAAGSSNLYAGFANDPVNHLDPDGREPILAYLGWTAVNTVIDVGIDYAFHLALDDESVDFDWERSVVSNFTINLATGGIGGKIAKLKHLQRIGPVGRWLIKEGIDLGLEVAAKGTLDIFFEGKDPKEAYAQALGQAVVGRASQYALNKLGSWAGKRIFSKSEHTPSVPSICSRCFSADTPVSTPEGPRSIAELRVGDRVTSTSRDNDTRDTNVDPSTWQLLKLRMPMLDESGDVLVVEMMRPREWVQQVHAAAGYWIDLRIPEMGIRGTAEVLSIEPAPSVQPGPGRVILSTFRHEDVVLEIKLAGNLKPLRPTPSHLLYSLDRNEFVRATELHAGERVRTRNDSAVIESISYSTGRRPVFEIEVEYDHQYFAGDIEVLSHNTIVCPLTGIDAHLRAGTALHIPYIEHNEFADWFRNILPADFDVIWNSSYQKSIKDRLRHPGGLHEWLQVSRADVFKHWGMTAEDIWDMRNPTAGLGGRWWTHGATGSTTAHNEMRLLIDLSSDFIDFRDRLRHWADTNSNLRGGSLALPGRLQRGRP